MVFFILTRRGYDDIKELISTAGAAIWVNRGVLSPSELSSLRTSGVDTTDFAAAVPLDESSVATALDTIAEHHPDSRIWVESLARDYNLDQIVALLEMHAQRATYGAVAGLLGVVPLSLMQRRDKCLRDSWVVSADNHLPSGYDADQMHPQLTVNLRVLSTQVELDAWLRART